MKANKIVTIWHFGDSDIPDRKVFRNVTLDSSQKIEKNGIKQKGFFNGASATVRIFNAEEIGVLPGDYLYLGKCFDEAIPIENALKIIEVKDNRQGAQKHWRIVCGG